MCTLEGYGHKLPIIKHCKNFKKLLMMGYNGMNTSNKKGIKKRMKTTFHVKAW